MADIINMPNPEPKGGSGLGLVAGLGLLGAGLYIAYRKLRGNTSAPGTGDTGTGGGGFWSEVFGGGSSSSGTSPGTTSPVPQIQQTPISSTNTGSTGSASSAYAAVKTTTTYGVDDYKPMSSSVSSFLAAGRTDEEKSALSTMLKAADALSPDYYVLESTRNSTPVYNVISGTTGQIVGGGAGISYADAVAGGYERRDNLLVITPPGDKTSQGTQSSNAAKALVKPTISASPVTGTVYGSGTSKSSGSTSKSSGSSGSSGGGSAVSSFVNTVKSGGTSSGSTSGSSGSSGSSGKTVTTSTGFTLTSKVNTNNSAISFLRNRK